MSDTLIATYSTSETSDHQRHSSARPRPGAVDPVETLRAGGGGVGGALTKAYAAQHFASLGEIPAQLTGVEPNDPALEPYLALAEELDLPARIHTAGTGADLPGFRTVAGTAPKGRE